ncbi:MAG: hypothetical protein JXA99_13035 [Candidatus Lokiarchaeota archaeon]|nr:hypothetical protein [Candidatus Lokiarchaeota archaeon]
MNDQEKKDKYIPFIGLVDDYVGRSAWDFYSWGHIAMGIGGYLILSLLITIPRQYMGIPELIPWWFVWILTILICGFLWELFENSLVYYWGWRNKGIDSLLNSIWDIIFVSIASAVMWLFQYIIVDLLENRIRWFYIVGIISFLIILIIYFIGYYITNQNTKNARKARKK